MSLTQGFSKEATQNESGLYLEAADFATLFERFIQEKRSLENRSEHTLKSYKLLFWRYKKYSDALCLPTSCLLGQFVIKMRQDGLSGTICNISIPSFNSFLSWIKENDPIQNPLRIKRLKEESDC